jgi:predicted AAA+ superfamily ATPase
MKVKPRYLTTNIQEDLKEKMVLVGGPRQVGKTTVAKELIEKDFKSRYYNWDKLSDRLIRTPSRKDSLNPVN